MSTTQLAAALFQLQQLDLEIDLLVAEQQTLASSLQNNASLRRLRAEQKTAQQQLADGVQARQDGEQVLADLEQRLKQHEQRLYGGSVTNAKELSALQQDVQYLRAQCTQQEDRVLEMMETVEKLNQALADKASAVSEAERAWQTFSEASTAKHEQLEHRLQERRTARAAQAARLDMELVKRYESMRKIRQGRVVSKVEQNSCQWCRVILTPSELQRVRVSPELQTCSNCGRILYYDR